MKIKPIFAKSLLIAALPFLTLPAGALINPNYPGNPGCNHCEDSSTASTGGCTSSYTSMNWSINVGMAKYTASNDYLEYFRTAVTEGAHGGHTMPRNLDTLLSYHNGGGIQNRQPLRLELSSPEIGAHLRDPASLTYNPNSSAEVIEQNGFVNQVLTDDALTQVDKLTDGFKIRVWNRDLITLGAKVNGLYPEPPATNVPMTEVVFAKPAGATDDLELTITETLNFGSTVKTTTQHIKEVMSATTGKPDTLTIKTFDGDDITAGSKLLKIEELTYSDRGAKVWDYHIERKFWTANTQVDGSMTPPTQTATFLTRHDYEKYKDFSTSAAGGGEGARRVISNTTGYNTSEASETIYTYVDNASNAHVHGRLQSMTRPDGSWEYYEYSDSPWASIVSESKYSSWKDVTMANRANARKTTTTVEAGKITRLTEIAGQKVAKRETTVSDNANGNSETVTKNWDGSAWHTFTSCRYAQGGALTTAGRLKWVEHADGTATIYTYAVANGDTTVTTRTGAGDSTGVTAGTEIIKVLNVNYIATSETVTDIASSLQLSSWTGSQEDNKGRPQVKTFNDGTSSTTIYGCCGIGNTTDRTGATAEYFRDALKRVYRVRRKASSTATTIDTTTAFSSLTTTVNLFDGTNTLFVSETAQSLGGLTVTSKSPDADNDGNKETTTRVTVNNVGGGKTTTVTYPDNTTSSSVSYTDGRAKSSTDQSTNTTTYNYGTFASDAYVGLDGGTWSQTTAPGGSQWSKTVSDQLGRSFRTDYVDGAVASQTYYLATSTAGSRGKLASSTDPDENASAGTGTTVSYAYNTEGERTTTTEAIADSQTRTTVADTSIVTDPDIGIAQKSTTTVNGILISSSYRSVDGYASKSVTLAGASTSTRTIPADGAWTITSTTPDGQSNVQTYTKGRLDCTESFDNSATPVSIAYTTYTYNNLGRTLATTDSRTGTTWFTDKYDHDDDTQTADVRRTAPLATDAGSPLYVETPVGHITRFTYDAMGRRLTTTLPDNSVTHTSYTDRGQTLATWGSQTYARLYQYDSLGRMSELRTYQNLTHGTEPTVDTGVAIPAQDGNPAVPATYAATQWLYDSQRGWLTEKNYDGETASGPGNTADYTYSASGRLKTRTWERGITTSYTYDQGSLSDVEYYGTAALMQTYLSKRSLWQGLVDQENPSATEAAIADAKAAMETAGTAYTDASDPDTPSISYSYDNFGRPSTVTQAGNSNAYVYDTSTMALITETVAYDTDNNGTADFTRVLHRHQDSLLRPSGFELKNGTAVEHSTAYTYDAAGRLSTLATGYPLPATPQFTYGYEANTYGLIKTVTGPAHTVTNTYEANRNVLSNKENKVTIPATPTVASNFAYTVNNLGQRTNLTTSGTAFSTAPVWAWSYNGLGELVEANDTSTANNDRAFQYDGIGNREKTVNGLLANLPATPNYTANAQNQYTAIGAATPSYDLDGNATSYPMPNDQSTNAQFIWDAENRLIEVKDGITTVATYQYDYLGRRISKTAGGTTTHYLYDGWNIITEYAGTTLSKSYTWGMDLSGSMQGAGGVGGLLAVTAHGSQSADDFYPTYDGNGNVSEYLDSAGAVQAHYEYDAFGNTIVSTGTKKDDFSHRFSTKPFDAETGLYYYGYRYYDPATGRWPSRDPIGEVGGINLYGFVGNNGMNAWDYLGLCVLTAAEKKVCLKDCQDKYDKCVDSVHLKAAEGTNDVEKVHRDAEKSLNDHLAKKRKEHKRKNMDQQRKMCSRLPPILKEACIMSSNGGEISMNARVFAQVKIGLIANDALRVANIALVETARVQGLIICAGSKAECDRTCECCD